MGRESDSKNNRCCFPVSCDSVALSWSGVQAEQLPVLERKSPPGVGLGRHFPKAKKAIFLFKDLQMKFRNNV